MPQATIFKTISRVKSTVKTVFNFSIPERSGDFMSRCGISMTSGSVETKMSTSTVGSNTGCRITLQQTIRMGLFQLKIMSDLSPPPSVTDLG